LEAARREEPVLMAQATLDLELEQASVATQREELVATAQAMLLPALELALVAVQTQELTVAPVLAAFSLAWACLLALAPAARLVLLRI
jgi:hypothetical protein